MIFWILAIFVCWVSVIQGLIATKGLKAKGLKAKGFYRNLRISAMEKREEKNAIT